MDEFKQLTFNVTQLRLKIKDEERNLTKLNLMLEKLKSNCYVSC